MELREQLQTALGETYRLERELGGGGMSRVFVADEPRLGRKVVIKVLSPELAAGISAERFEREIKFAASLQQANIVPVLTAGETNGLPYYSMPYVDGDSLRSRLAQGPIAAKDVLRVLGDVARALQYAHERGIVHRDVKPDNVLLSGGTAVVTDFGIAKALSASRTRDGTATLTQFGTSIGTPAYMAPEQAAGDPDVDHRADIYAFGCMAYELVTGHPPFHARSAQRVLAAHVSEPPQGLAELRPDLPASLCDLVMHCLEKQPARRPQSAREMLSVLDSIAGNSEEDRSASQLLRERNELRRALLVYAGAFVVVSVAAKVAIAWIGLPDWVFPGALVAMALGLPAILFTAYGQRANPNLSWRRATLGVSSIVAAFIVVVGVFMLLRTLGIGPAGSLLAAGRLERRAPIIIADFRTSRTDTSVGSVVTEAVRANLAESPSITLVAPAAVVSTIRRMQLPPDAPLTTTLARQIAARQGVRAIVDGDITGLGGGWIVTVRLVSADSGSVLASYQGTVNGPKDLVDGVDRLARRLRGKIGESLRSVQGSPPLAEVTTSSLEALRLYTEGTRAFDVNADYRTAIPLLRRAVAVDSNFAMAWRKLGTAYRNSNGGPVPASDSAFEHAYRLRSRLPDNERYFTEAIYFHLGPGLDRRRAITAYQAMLDLGDTLPSALNDLGVAYSSLRQRERAESLFAFALRRDSANQAATNLMETLVFEGKLDSAMALSAQMRRRLPKNAALFRRAVRLMYLHGEEDEALRLVDSVAKLNQPQTRSLVIDFLSTDDVRHGRIRSAERRYRDSPPQRPENPNGSPPLAFIVANNDAWFRQDSASAVRRLDSMVASPAIAMLPRSHPGRLAVAAVYALAGRPDRARPLLAQFVAGLTDSVSIRRNAPNVHAARATIALAENRARDALGEYRAADSLPDGPAGRSDVVTLVNVARAFDLAGQSDSAIVFFEKYLSTPDYERPPTDATYIAGTYKRLGELYEAKGDRQRAASYYAKFIALWEHADPELQPRVLDAKRRLARLSDVERK